MPRVLQEVLEFSGGALQDDVAVLAVSLALDGAGKADGSGG